MKAILEKSSYKDLEVAKAFNSIIESHTTDEEFKGWVEDVMIGGCISGIVGEFIYHSDCKQFYIQHIDELEDMKQELEEEYGPISNRHKQPHYTFIVWLCFEEYCRDLFNKTLF
jgi:hypothetical protein